MNIKFLKITLGLALTAFAFNANAQKTYTQGTAVYEASVAGVSQEAKIYFKGDSSATKLVQGPATITFLRFKDEYLAILVDVPLANLKKAAVATPAELEEGLEKIGTFTFTPTTETKQINGFNCKKVIAKDKSGSASDMWVTTDIVAPASAYSDLLTKAGGFPVVFTLNQMGKMVTNTLKTITDEKAPAGFFSIPQGFEKITLGDLSKMNGGR